MKNDVLNIKEKEVLLHQEDLGNSHYFWNFNKAWISGVLESDFYFSHEFCGRRMYTSRIIVRPEFAQENFVPIMVSENLVTSLKVKGKNVEVAGELRSYNEWKEGKSHLKLHVFAKHINICERIEELEELPDQNIVYLEGTVCKPPVVRKTPVSDRYIADVFIAVNRKNKYYSDYIPTIVWRKGAEYVKQEVAFKDRVKLYGKIQNRLYFKRNSPESEEGEYKEAYEVSVIRMIKA